jgi:hypothetical protein
MLCSTGCSSSNGSRCSRVLLCTISFGFTIQQCAWPQACALAVAKQYGHRSSCEAHPQTLTACKAQ